MFNKGEEIKKDLSRGAEERGVTGRRGEEEEEREEDWTGVEMKRIRRKYVYSYHC